MSNDAANREIIAELKVNMSEQAAKPVEKAMPQPELPANVDDRRMIRQDRMEQLPPQQGRPKLRLVGVCIDPIR
jgi:hypothetical protein